MPKKAQMNANNPAPPPPQKRRKTQKSRSSSSRSSRSANHQDNHATPPLSSESSSSATTTNTQWQQTLHAKRRRCAPLFRRVLDWERTLRDAHALVLCESDDAHQHIDNEFHAVMEMLKTHQVTLHAEVERVKTEQLRELNEQLHETVVAVRAVQQVSNIIDIEGDDNNTLEHQHDKGDDNQHHQSTTTTAEWQCQQLDAAHEVTMRVLQQQQHSSAKIVVGMRVTSMHTLRTTITEWQRRTQLLPEVETTHVVLRDSGVLRSLDSIFPLATTTTMSRVALEGVTLLNGGRWAEAFRHLETHAAEDADCQALVGECHRHGLGTSRHEDEGKLFFRLASKRGSLYATAVTLYLQNDNQQCSALLRTMANDDNVGISVVQLQLGLNAADCGFAIQAAKWYRLSAEQGYAPAQLQLADCYKEGDGVSEDEDEAKKWSRLAAEQEERQSIAVQESLVVDHDDSRTRDDVVDELRSRLFVKSPDVQDLAKRWHSLLSKVATLSAHQQLSETLITEWFENAASHVTRAVSATVPVARALQQLHRVAPWALSRDVVVRVLQWTLFRDLDGLAGTALSWQAPLRDKPQQQLAASLVVARYLATYAASGAVAAREHFEWLLQQHLQQQLPTSCHRTAWMLMSTKLWQWRPIIDEQQHQHQQRSAVATIIARSVLHYPFQRAFGSYGYDKGQFNNPRGVAVMSNGTYLAVADANNHRVQVVRARYGAFVRQWGSEGSEAGQFNEPVGIACHRGEVFVVDRGNDRVQVFTEQGQFLRQWGSQGNGNGQFDEPWGIAVCESRKEVLVTDQWNHRVQVFDLQHGTYLRHWGSHGDAAGQFNEPTGIAVSPDGEEVFVCESDNHRVQVFRVLDGLFLREWGTCGSEIGQFNSPSFLTVMPTTGDVVVGDYFNNRVQVFGSDGTFVRAFGEKGSDEGQFQYPRGVCVLPASGELVVADENNHRLQVFR